MRPLIAKTYQIGKKGYVINQIARRNPQGKNIRSDVEEVPADLGGDGAGFAVFPGPHMS
mgnify:CR=1 FL=1